MRFNSIILKNYRQYRDVTLAFPKIKKTDLHMIVASNGVGKTNLMNAINWCLYGDEPHLGDDILVMKRIACLFITSIALERLSRMALMS